MRKLFFCFIALMLPLLAAFSVASEPSQDVIDVGEVDLISDTGRGAPALIAESERSLSSPGAEYAVDNLYFSEMAMISGDAPTFMPSGGAAASGHYTRPAC